LVGKIVNASIIETHTDLYVKQSVNLYKFMYVIAISATFYVASNGTLSSEQDSIT